MTDSLLIGNKEELVHALQDHFKGRTVADVEANITRLEGGPEVQVRVWLENEDSFILDELVCQARYDSLTGRYYSGGYFPWEFQFSNPLWLEAPDDCQSVIEAVPLAEPLNEAEGWSLPELGIKISTQVFFNPVTNETTRYYFDPKTNGTMDEEGYSALLEEENKMALARYGLLRKDFYDELTGLAASNPDDKIAVRFVVKTDAGLFPKPLLPDELEDQEGYGIESVETAIAEFRTQTQEVIQHLNEPALAFLQSAGLDVHPASLMPLIYAQLTPAEILELARRPDFEEWFSIIEDDRTQELFPTAVMTNGKGAVGLPLIEHKNYTTDSVRVGVMESSASNANGKVRNLPQCGLHVASWAEMDGISFPFGDHATGVASLIGSDYGVAPGADIYSIAFESGGWGSYDSSLLWGFQQNVSIFNMSFGTPRQGASYDDNENRLDFFLSYYMATVIVAAGNSGNKLGGGFTCLTSNPYISIPAGAYNVITVGSLDDKGDYDLVKDSTLESKDEMYNGSCFKNPDLPNHEKPELAAPGTNVTVAINQTGAGCTTPTATGTSVAAPHVAGAVAVLAANQASILQWPELSKAILMASALNGAGQGKPLSDKAGAGGLDVAAAYEVVKKDHDRVFSLPLNGGEWTIPLGVPPTAVNRIKVAAAWISQPNESGLPRKDDVNIYLYSGTTLVASSTGAVNNYDVIDYLTSGTGSYSIKVVSRPNPITKYVAVAWSAGPNCAFSGGNVDADDYCGEDDNCPNIANNDQADADGDGKGDVCDPCDDRFDQDKDGVADNCDNCQSSYNPDQHDMDDDGQGDPCDWDIDGDKCLNFFDFDPLNDQEVSGFYVSVFCRSPSNGLTYAWAGNDSDGDGFRNCSTDDNDGDGIKDADDICPDDPGDNPGSCTTVVSCPLPTIRSFDPRIPPRYRRFINRSVYSRWGF